MKYLIAIGIIIVSLVCWVTVGVSSESTGHGEGGHGEGDHGGNNTFLWRVLCFLVIVIAVFFGARGPMKKFLRSRTTTIQNEITEAREQLDKALQANGDINNRLSKLAEEMETMKSENEELIRRSIENMEREKETRLARLQELMERKVESEFAVTRKRAMMLTVDHALEKVSKKFQENPDLVSDFRKNFEDILNQVTKS